MEAQPGAPTEGVFIAPATATSRGLAFRRYYTTAGIDPFDTVAWETRDAVITGEDGKSVFEQRRVEIPRPWSQTATNVVVSKYFRGALGTPERERSVRPLISRVVDTIAGWGREGGYFADEEAAAAFHAELTHVLLHQIACFNSPVWFNVGIEAKPQCSACFINSVEDKMASILDLAKTEGMLFKHGSGTGSNLSTLRSSREGLSGGGTASGPVSFMKGLDAFAGVIKSGGKTRRAAKMVILDVDHPDVEDFIRCKEIEEKKARALVEAGWEGDFGARGGAYESLFYQNANHSVRAGDDFMQAVREERSWTTHAVTDGRPMDTYEARDLLRHIAEATWSCGDPGMQFADTINSWHTCPASGPIRASNPCSEFLFLDDSACNLASLNLLKFLQDTPEKGGHPLEGFDVEGFQHVCRVVISAQEILVSNAGYPTAKIEETSHRFRPLGLGYSNLGALLMACGLPYDSDEGRDAAAAVTALMSGSAYAQSARIAEEIGAFEAFEANREPMLGVLRKHRQAMERIEASHVPAKILKAGRAAWDEAIDAGTASGIRNSQISALAPTGTIAFMMDCDTTGVEPDIALVKYKRLVGGGQLKIVNQTVRLALERLGYSRESIHDILDHVDEHDTIEDAESLDERHLPVFDCALTPREGSRSIHYLGHLKMLSAVQPFISGAISKTINMPETATVDHVRDAYVEAWRLGLKAVAIYRDGCKSSQPLTIGEPKQRHKPTPAAVYPARRRLPDERQAVTHKFSIDQHDGYITVGLYDDGTPGEIFVVMAKEGSTISGLIDAFATAVSIALQYGVPLRTLVEKFSHTRFEPSGFTQNPQIRIAKSITDYIFRWLGHKYLDAEEQQAAGLVSPLVDGSGNGSSARASGAKPASSFLHQQDSPGCHVCGSIMVRSGTCYECLNCGTTSGCS